MPFEDAHAAIRSDLVRQGERVQSLLLSAVEAWFDLDEDKANAAVMADDEIDRIDVEIERASVPLLAMGETDHARIRSVLTVVKLNNDWSGSRTAGSTSQRLCCTIEMIWIVPQIPPFV